MTPFELHCVTQYIDVPVHIAHADIASCPRVHELLVAERVVSSPICAGVPGLEFINARISSPTHQNKSPSC